MEKNNTVWRYVEMDDDVIFGENILILYVCMVTHKARVWINPVRFPFLHVVN